MEDSAPHLPGGCGRGRFLPPIHDEEPETPRGDRARGNGRRDRHGDFMASRPGDGSLSRRGVEGAHGGPGQGRPGIGGAAGWR